MTIKNTMKEKLNAGEIVVGVQLRLGVPAIAEMFSKFGFDWIALDCEHAPQTPVGVQQQLQGISCGTATPFIRPYKNDRELFKMYLDMGAMGFLVPEVHTAEMAKAGASACFYPPRGNRGCGPSRANSWGLVEDYYDKINDEVMYIPIIESEEAIRNIDEIAVVDGVDVLIVGPVDLSISLGVPHQLDHPKVQDAIKKTQVAAENAGKVAGSCIYGGDMFLPDIYKKFVDAGYRFLLIGGDEWMLTDGCKKVMDSLSRVRN